MYMAPEVYLKQPYNDKADVFSFAVVAYEVRCAPRPASTPIDPHMFTLGGSLRGDNWVHC